MKPSVVHPVVGHNPKGRKGKKAKGKKEGFDRVIITTKDSRSPRLVLSFALHYVPIDWVKE